MYNPHTYSLAGSLEVWDTEQKGGRLTGVTALDQRLCWFPDVSL